MCRFMKGTKKCQWRRLVLLLFIMLFIFQSALSAFAMEPDSVESEAMKYSAQKETEYSAEAETIAVPDTNQETVKSLAPIGNLDMGTNSEWVDQVPASDNGAETEDGSEQEANGNTEGAAEPTENSFYERLMACETLTDILGLLESEEAPALLLTETERNDFADYVYNKLVQGDWPDENAESNVDSIMTILFGNDNDNVEMMAIADRYDLEIEAGNSGTISNVTSRSNRRVVDADGNTVSTITVSQEGNSGNRSLTVTARDTAKAGVYSIQYRKGWGTWTTEYTILVTAAVPQTEYKVYVYVAGSGISDECLELLGIDKSTLDGNGYFPAGEIILDAGFFAGKETAANTPGQPLITSEADWKAVLEALGELNTATLIDEYGVQYSKNKGNNVGDYLNQASADLNKSWGSMCTALFRWNNTENYGFSDETVKYHLDLSFNTKKITFITGNNGIESGSAKDGTEVDSRVYITGSEIQAPRNLTIPEGYKFAGYFKDQNFTEPWDGIGTPLNENQVVYIKIVKEEKIVLYYEVAEGVGTLSSYSEGVDTDAEKAAGSTATAGDGYRFAGWYADKECTESLSENMNYIPEKPEAGWIDGTTYYAKFVPDTSVLTIKKTVSGNLCNQNKKFAFTIISSEALPDGRGYTLSSDKHTAAVELGHNEYVTIQVPCHAVVIVKENPEEYTYSITSATVETGEVVAPLSYTDVSSEEYKGISFTMSTEDISVLINTEKNANIDTGIFLDSLPYILILSIVIVGCVIKFLKRCRNHSAD